MATTGRRRGHGEDSIYFDAANKCWTAAVSLGHSPDGKRLRRKVTGKTKTEVRDKLKVLRKELEAGIQTPGFLHDGSVHRGLALPGTRRAQP